MSQKILNLCLERYNFVKFGETTKSSHTVLCINNAYSFNSQKYKLTPTEIASKHGNGYVFTLNYDFDRPLFTIAQKSYTLDGTSGNIVFEGIDPISKGGSKYLRKVTVSPVKLSDGSYLLEVTGDEYLRIGTTGAALGDEGLESLNEKIVATGGIEKSVATIGGKQVLKLDASGSTGAKEIVYFDVDPSDPPTGIYAAIGQALSNGKLPAIRSEGKLYQYTSTGTDVYNFAGVFSLAEVSYEWFEVLIDDTAHVGKLDASLGYVTLPGDGSEEYPAWAKVCELDLESLLNYTSYGLALLFTSDHANTDDGPSESGIFVLDIGSNWFSNSNSRNASWIAYTTGAQYSKILGVKVIVKLGVPSNPAYAPYPVYKAEVWAKYYTSSRTIIVNALQNARYNYNYGMVPGLFKFPENHIATPQSTEPSYDDTEEYTYRYHFYPAESPDVSYTHAQSLTTEQKSQARDNIGAASASDLAEIIPSGTSSSNKLVTESDLEAAQDSWQSGFTPKGEATVSQIDALTTQSNGDQYIVTDSGTITAGSVAVVAGDTVAWNGTDEVWYKVTQYAKASDVTALQTRASDIERNVDCLDAGYYLTFEQGTIASATGDDSSESHRVRTVGYQKIETFEKFYAPLNWIVLLFAYTSESTDGYLGDATLIFAGSGDRTKYKDAVLTAYPTAKFVRFVVKDKDDATITPSSVTDAGIFCKCDYSVSDIDKLAKKNEGDIAQINSELDMMNATYGFTLEQGTIGGAAGTDSSSNSAVRSVGYFDIDQMDKVYAPVGYQVIAFAYSSSDATGYLGNRRIIHGTQGSRYAGKNLILEQYPTAKFARFVVKKSDESTVTPSDVVTAGVYGVFWLSIGAIEESVQTDAKEYIYDKELTLTADKEYTVSPGKHRKKNAIITIDSMYAQEEGVTDVPYIQLSRSSKGVDNGMHAYYTCKYFCGKNGTYTRQMFRVPSYGVTSGDLSITLIVPEGVTFKVREISIAYDDAINRDYCGIELCAHGYCGEGAPTNTLAAFEAAAKLGYRYCIAVPKVTADGVYVCLHDDDSIQATARNDDGSQIAQEYRDRPVSDFTYDELLQFDFGIMRGLNYKGERIPLLEDFFALCARTGMHPMLSVHPNLSGHWDDIKALAVKYNLLNKLNIKSDYSNLAVPMTTLGDDIESYTIDELSTSTDRVTAFDALKRNHNITKARCVIEYGKSVITDALISNALSNGYQVGWVNADGVDLRPYIAKGVTIFTEDRNSSVGLPW